MKDKVKLGSGVALACGQSWVTSLLRLKKESKSEFHKQYSFFFEAKYKG